VLVGGLVATIFGRLRTTIDIDVIIDNHEENIIRLQRVLKNNKFDFTENEILVAIKERSHCSIFHKEFPFRIDLQGIYSPLDERSIQNRIKMIILGQQTFVEKPEDLIVAKLVYGSQQDLDDVKAIVLRQKRDLDMDYIHSFAIKEGVLDKFDLVLKELS